MRHRTTGIGIIPYDVFARMTPDERARIQGIGGAPGTEVLTVVISRTKTPEMDPDKLDALKTKSKVT